MENNNTVGPVLSAEEQAEYIVDNIGTGEKWNFQIAKRKIADAILAAAQSKQPQFDVTVGEFAKQMQIELTANSHKGDWRNWKDVDAMLKELKYHEEKLNEALILGNKDEVKEYLADCGNILMFIGNAGGLYNSKQPQYNDSQGEKESLLKAVSFLYCSLTNITAPEVFTPSPTLEKSIEHANEKIDSFHKLFPEVYKMYLNQTNEKDSIQEQVYLVIDKDEYMRANWKRQEADYYAYTEKILAQRAAHVRARMMGR